MSAKLQRLMDWAENNSISLDEASIEVHFNTLNFWQNRQTRREFQVVKRAIGMFERKGKPPYIELEANLYLEYVEDGEGEIDAWRIKWNGAYECKSLGYDCGQAEFKEDTLDPDPSDVEMEDHQLEKAGLTP